MKTNKAIFFGYHHCSPASAEFDFVAGLWRITLTVGDKTVQASAGTKGVRPCMTHAAYLLNEYFPVVRKRAAKKKRSTHAATVVQSAFVESKSGARLRVVRRSDHAN